MHKHMLRAALACAAFCAAGAALAQAPATVAKTAKGEALVDGRGMALYTFDKDADGKSNCAGPCAALWPPLAAAATAAPASGWTIVKRDDGAAQWAYKGKPLYTFSKDAKPGEISGDGFKDVWHLATP